MATTHLVTAEELLEMGSDAPYELWEGVLKHVITWRRAARAPSDPTF